MRDLGARLVVGGAEQSLVAAFFADDNVVSTTLLHICSYHTDKVTKKTVYCIERVNKP